MPIPGFRVVDAVVGKRLKFDAIWLEKFIDPATELRATDDTNDYIREAISQYCGRKPEICNATYGGSSFNLLVYEDDIEVVSKIIARELEFEIHEAIHAFKPRDEHDLEKISYRDIFKDSDIDIELDDVSWDDISDKSVDVEAAVREAIPEGIETPEFTTEAFRDFVFDHVKPAVDEGGWKGGNAWLINLGFHELRNGNYQEASYAFDGARLGLTKHSIFENESPLGQYLNRCLVSLRHLCFYHDSPGDRRREHELFLSMDDRPFVFVPKFLSKPELHDLNFRFSNNIWIANALVFAAAVANAMDPPNISRSEVDPFGTNTTSKNKHFVLKAARRLFEIDEYETWEEWSASQGARSFPHLEQIDFAALSPEIIITRIFSSAGFDIRNYGEHSLRVGDDQVVDVSYDSLLSKKDQFYLVKIVDGGELKVGDIQESVTELQGVEQDLTIFFLSSEEYPESVIDYSEETEELDLYYLDIDEESIRSVHSSEKIQTGDLAVTSEILGELSELYRLAESEENSQKKGDLLEKLMERIFELLIPDTDILETNVRTASEEIDLLLRNREVTYPWKTLGTPIQVECKNWSSPAGTNVVKIMRGDMESIGPMCETGILVSWEGISDGEPRKNATQKIREYRQDNVKILVLDKSDILDLIETGEVKRVFEEKHKELITR